MQVSPLPSLSAGFSSSKGLSTGQMWYGKRVSDLQLDQHSHRDGFLRFDSGRTGVLEMKQILRKRADREEAERRAQDEVFNGSAFSAEHIRDRSRPRTAMVESRAEVRTRSQSSPEKGALKKRAHSQGSIVAPCNDSGGAYETSSWSRSPASTWGSTWGRLCGGHGKRVSDINLDGCSYKDDIFTIDSARNERLELKRYLRQQCDDKLTNGLYDHKSPPRRTSSLGAITGVGIGCASWRATPPGRKALSPPAAGHLETRSDMDSRRLQHTPRNSRKGLEKYNEGNSCLSTQVPDSCVSVATSGPLRVVEPDLHLHRSPSPKANLAEFFGNDAAQGLQSCRKSCSPTNSFRTLEWPPKHTATRAIARCEQ